MASFPFYTHILAGSTVTCTNMKGIRYVVTYEGLFSIQGRWDPNKMGGATGQAGGEKADAGWLQQPHGNVQRNRNYTRWTERSWGRTNWLRHTIHVYKQIKNKYKYNKAMFVWWMIYSTSKQRFLKRSK